MSFKSRISFTFPFMADISENKRLMWSPRNRRMFSAKEYKDAKGALILVISYAVAKAKAVFEPKKRVWVSLSVYRPSNHSDPANFVKIFNDSISSVIKLNDNLFDGEYKGFIDKQKPRFEVVVSQ